MLDLSVSQLDLHLNHEFQGFIIGILLLVRWLCPGRYPNEESMQTPSAIRK
jgi:hypothetical protein